MVAVFVVGILVTGTVAYAAEKPNGKPFEVLWDAIVDLQTQIDTIELTPGPAGSDGADGADGVTGPQGEQGPSEIIKRTASEVFEQNDLKTFKVTCEADEVFLINSVVVTYDPIPSRIPVINTGSSSVSCNSCAGNTGILSHVTGWNVQVFDTPNGFTVPTTVTISIVCVKP